MATELPGLDDPISFAVDDGAQAGPFPMSQIVDSIKNGQRVESTLVWWAGQPEWLPFNQVPELVDLLQPPPPDATSAQPITESAGAASTGGSLLNQAENRWGSSSSVVEQAQEAAAKVDDLAASEVDAGLPEAIGQPISKEAEPEVQAAEATADPFLSSGTMADQSGEETTGDLGAEVPEDTNLEMAAAPSSATLDSLFAEMVQRTWRYQRNTEWASQLEDVLLGGIVSEATAAGNTLAVLISDGSEHRASFIRDDVDAIVKFELSRAAADQGGESALVKVSWGRPVEDPSGAVDGARSEHLEDLESDALGQLGVEADLDAGAALTTIELVWPVTEYVLDNNELDRDRLRESVVASIHGLQHYWNTWFA